MLACNGDGLLGGGSRTASDFGSLSEDRAWTWRSEVTADTASVDLDVDETQLLHGRWGGGAIELRRGSRWADAETVGEITFSQPDEGLMLGGWTLDGESGGSALLAEARPENGVPTAHCETVLDLPVETFYGLFQRTLVADCGGEGVWSFEAGVGLIQVEAGGLVLDLVAPY